MEDSKLYIRLREMRLQHGYTSQESLAEALNINPQAVKSWEKYKNPSEPKLKNLLALCSLYNCDLDYLIGTIKERKHDIKTACELTGLSADAIEKIYDPDLNNPFGKILSHMIETEQFYNFITTYKIFLTFVREITADDSDDSSPWLELNKDSVVLGTQQAARHFKQEVLSAMERICDDDLYGKLNSVRKQAMISRLKSNHDEVLKEHIEKDLDKKQITRDIKYIEREMKILSEEKETLEEILQLVSGK